MNNNILDKLIEIIPSWKNGKNIIIEQLQGGISNIIFKITSDNLEPIIFRIYGKNINNLISREEEIEIYKFVSEKNLAPKLLCLFDEGRIEKFIIAEPLNEKNIYLFQDKIIKKIKKIHSLNYNNKLLLWDRLCKWNSLLKDICFKVQIDSFKEEIDKMKVQIDTLPQNHYLLKQVFCHNDLLPSNILVDKDKNIHIIDYEYAGVNYLGFELANHVIYYDFENISLKKDIFEFLKKFKNREPTDLDLKILNIFIKIVYFKWMLWGILSKDNQDINFDYTKYIKICENNYLLLKKIED